MDAVRQEKEMVGCGTAGKGNGLSPFNIITTIEHSISAHRDYRVYIHVSDNEP